MGIAQRHIRTAYAHKLRKRNLRKPLPQNMKTLGNWIQIMRQKKNLSSYHLAAKMGIASALIASWEDGKSEPDALQMRKLRDLLGLDAQGL